MCFYVLSTVRFYEVWDGFWNLYMLLYTWHLPLKKIKIHQHNHRLSQAHNKHGTSFLLICVANLTLFSSNVNRLTLKSWAMTIKWPNNCRPWAQCRHARHCEVCTHVGSSSQSTCCQGLRVPAEGTEKQQARVQSFRRDRETNVWIDRSSRWRACARVTDNHMARARVRVRYYWWNQHEARL